MTESLTTNICPRCLRTSDPEISDRVDELSRLPYLSITSPVGNTPHLTSADADLHMPLDHNFKYYSLHDFHSNQDISDLTSTNNNFSVLHHNIRSLSFNFDSFLDMLSNLNCPFSVIGLCETKFKVNKENVTNIDITGYHDFVSQPSLLNMGGVGFYVKESLLFDTRPELSTKTLDYEALWIEISMTNQSNILCGVTYRHPSGNLENFLDYMNKTIEQIHQENKLCLVMGDFNIDLLKIDSHPNSENFLDLMGSYFFQPQILQPTRITEHSATLIDNICINSLEHFSISGNLVCDLTDHLPNFTIINKYCSVPSNIKIYKRDYSKFNEAALITEVQSINWETVFASNDTDPSFHV